MGSWEIWRQRYTATASSSILKENLSPWHAKFGSSPSSSPAGHGRLPNIYFLALRGFFLQDTDLSGLQPVGLSQGWRRCYTHRKLPFCDELPWSKHQLTRGGVHVNVHMFLNYIKEVECGVCDGGLIQSDFLNIWIGTFICISCSSFPFPFGISIHGDLLDSFQPPSSLFRIPGHRWVNVLFQLTCSY